MSALSILRSFLCALLAMSFFLSGTAMCGDEDREAAYLIYIDPETGKYTNEEPDVGMVPPALPQAEHSYAPFLLAGAALLAALIAACTISRRRKITVLLLLLPICMPADLALSAEYVPQRQVEVADIVTASNVVLARPDIPLRGDNDYVEDIVRVNVAGMLWDLGMSVHEPADSSDVAIGADERKIGIFLLHGGSGDFKSMHRQARILSQKFGYKVVSMSYPGRHAFHTESRDWPGQNFRDDGSVRTPIWMRGEFIGRDEYDVIYDTAQRPRYGTRRLAKAKPGTNFYYRMAAWPLALEAGGIAAMQKHFPAGEYSIYLHGHSTGGPLVNMLSQRVPNVAGMLAVENSSFGYIYRAQAAWGGQLGKVGSYALVRDARRLPSRSDPFDELYIRSWRDSARYVGPELLGSEGPEALMRLPMVMEDILDGWQHAEKRPQFKAEYVITHGIVDSLTAAAEVTAKRMRLEADETDALIEHYIGLTQELAGPGVKPVPPVMFQISAFSRDHSREVYEQVVIPLYEKMQPAPKYSLTQFMAGKHGYMASDEELGLPFGIGPAVFLQWDRAIKSGWFLTDRTRNQQ